MDMIKDTIILYSIRLYKFIKMMRFRNASSSEQLRCDKIDAFEHKSRIYYDTEHY